MADTGAPWNIPFAEPSDLVRDWPALSEDVADAVAAGLSAAGGLVAVQYATSSTQVTTTSTTFVTTGLSVSITPTSEDNDILVFATVPLTATRTAVTSSGVARVRIHDGTTSLVEGTMRSEHTGTSGTRRHESVQTLAARHSPASTSTVTYTVQMLQDGNNTSIFCDTAGDLGTIIAMEVKV
jgi:hypothetical protein